MEDREIVDLYWERSETAIIETENKYGRYCRYIAYQILRNDEDASECANDTYLKTWNTIPPSRPESLKAYVGKISNRLALDRYNEQHAQKRGGGQIPLIFEELSECVADQDNGFATCDAVALRDALNKFLWSLPKKTRGIFIRRYWYASSIEDIATDYSMKISTVSMLMLRTRKKLKDFLYKEGFNI